MSGANGTDVTSLQLELVDLIGKWRERGASPQDAAAAVSQVAVMMRVAMETVGKLLQVREAP